MRADRARTPAGAIRRGRDGAEPPDQAADLPSLRARTRSGRAGSPTGPPRRAWPDRRCCGATGRVRGGAAAYRPRRRQSSWRRCRCRQAAAAPVGRRPRGMASGWRRGPEREAAACPGRSAGGRHIRGVPPRQRPAPGAPLPAPACRRAIARPRGRGRRAPGLAQAPARDECCSGRRNEPRCSYRSRIDRCRSAAGSRCRARARPRSRSGAELSASSPAAAVVPARQPGPLPRSRNRRTFPRRPRQRSPGSRARSPSSTAQRAMASTRRHRQPTPDSARGRRVRARAALPDRPGAPCRGAAARSLPSSSGRLRRRQQRPVQFPIASR